MNFWNLRCFVFRPFRPLNLIKTTLKEVMEVLLEVLEVVLEVLDVVLMFLCSFGGPQCTGQLLKGT